MSLLIGFAFLLFVIFGCSSISQSYTSTKQAEAVIETNQTAQLALGGQIAISIMLTLVIAILAFTVLALLYKLLKKQPAISQELQRPASYFSEDVFPDLFNPDTQYKFSVSHDERENEPSMLPSSWGW